MKYLHGKLSADIPFENEVKKTKKETCGDSVLTVYARLLSLLVQFII